MKTKLYTIVLLIFIPCLLFCVEKEPKSLPAQTRSSYLSATEDLMKEHGVLNRILLIYQEISSRINNRIFFPQSLLQEIVHLNRDFIEDFHEMLEEKYVFPYFLKANLYKDSVEELIKEHIAGKKFTEYLLKHSSDEEIEDQVQAMILAGYLDVYVRMMRPHEAKESSELFPSFRTLMPEEEFNHLGQIFETIGTEKFGKNGYENIISQLTIIEHKLGLYTLHQENKAASTGRYIPMTFTLSSPSFANKAPIPITYTCQGRGCSPKLVWNDPPSGTESFALIVDDPDAPDPKAPKMVWVHWVLYNIPKETRELKEAIQPYELPYGTEIGLNDSKKAEYGPPCAPIGTHRYYFKLYALSKKITDLSNPTTKKELEKAMDGAILAKAELIGTFKRQ